jgi:misacylated tRNA(Ala) deacylase
MTKEIFREDAYAQSCEAQVTGHEHDGIILNQTVFYPEGGGQPGDSGSITLVDGTRLIVDNTRKPRSGDGIVHVLADPALAPDMGADVTATIDWERRHIHMRMHTCLHLLCSLIDGGVTGGSIGEVKSRLDFDLQDTKLDKEQITADLNRLIEEDHELSSSWITDQEMTERADLVRTMSVKPPMGKGTVRLMEIAGIDLQPCGGTHVKSTAEIGRVRVGKIENKGKHNRRVNVLFGDE